MGSKNVKRKLPQSQVSSRGKKQSGLFWQDMAQNLTSISVRGYFDSITLAKVWIVWPKTIYKVTSYHPNNVSLITFIHRLTFVLQFRPYFDIGANGRGHECVCTLGEQGLLCVRVVHGSVFYQCWTWPSLFQWLVAFSVPCLSGQDGRFLNIVRTQVKKTLTADIRCTRHTTHKFNMDIKLKLFHWKLSPFISSKWPLHVLHFKTKTNNILAPMCYLWSTELESYWSSNSICLNTLAW